jgi:hypothetical protein
MPLGREATLTPRVGGSALVLGGLGELSGFGVTTGYNAGVRLVGRTGPTAGVRLDFTHHWFAGHWGDHDPHDRVPDALADRAA